MRDGVSACTSQFPLGFFEQYGCYNIAIMFPLQIPVIYYITAFILSCVSHSTLGLHVDSSAVKL